jgi:hypothetical protein
MASGFPASIDNFTDPLSNSPLNSPSHSALHTDVNDAVEKIETYMGLVKVIPTGATNATVGATGTVTVGTAVSSVTVSGCFSSTYDAYEIVYTGGTTNATNNLAIQMGSTTTGYYGNIIYSIPSAGTTILGLGVNNAASWTYVGDGTSGGGTRLACSLYAPNLAARTTISAKYMGTGTAAGAYGTFNGNLDNSTQYTAFTITTNTGTLTGGTIRVYGYRN